MPNFFLYEWSVFEKLKTSLEACFLTRFVIFKSSFYKVRTNHRTLGYININDTSVFRLQRWDWVQNRADKKYNTRKDEKLDS